MKSLFPALAALLLLLCSTSRLPAQNGPLPFTPHPMNFDTPPSGASTGPSGLTNSDSPDSNNDPLVTVQFPNSPIGDIINAYEALTGKRIIRDSNLAANAGNLNIICSQKMPRSQAIQFIAANLLLNGFVIQPGPDNSLKIINTGSGKNPRSEGVPLYANAADLPKGDQFVSYYMPLQYIPSNQALAAFIADAAPHGYGSYQEIPHTQALLLNENTSVIRQLIALKELIDVPPAKLVTKFIKLERADAERVSDAINKLLDAEKKGQAASTPGAVPPPDAKGMLEGQLVAGDTQVVPDARTNTIMIFTREANLSFLEDLVRQFDQSSNEVKPLSRHLNYITALEVLPVIGDLLTDSKDDTAKVSSGTTPSSGTPTSQSQPSPASAGGSSPGGAGSATQSLLLGTAPDFKPSSLIVGKTKVVADVRSNSIIVVGPPESIEKVSALLDEMDRKPLQVYLSTVVGKLQLTGDSQLAVDLLQNYSNFVGNNGVATGSFNNTANASARLVPGTLSNAAVFPAIAGTTVYGGIGSALSYYVTALQSTGRFTVLARPSVYAANNKKAYVTSGQQIPYAQSTLSNLNTTDNTTAAQQSTTGYINVNLTLEIIPLINEKKEINLQVAQQNQTELGSTVISGNTAPIIGNDTLVTTVTIPNNGTLVLGGLIRDSNNQQRTGVPILSNIPLLGFFFRGDTRSRERDELVVLIEPHVIESDDDLTKLQKDETPTAAVAPESKKFLEATPPSTIKTNGKVPNWP